MNTDSDSGIVAANGQDAQQNFVSPPRAKARAHLADLTAARALFALWVFAYHLNLQLFAAEPFGALTPVVRRGYLGVDAFFILSGLILAHAHPGLGPNPASWRRFALRRLLRIYPVHIAVMALLAAWLSVAALAGLAPRDPGRFSAREAGLHLALLHGWGISDRWAWNYPSWSISSEWAGYLLFPLLWWQARRLATTTALVLLLLLVPGLALVEAGGGGMRLNLTFHGALPRFFCEFAAGILLARLLAAPSPFPRAAWLAAAGGLLLLAGIVLVRDTLAVAGLALLLAALYRNALAGGAPWLARLPGALFLGTVSYAFYMSFAPVEALLAAGFRRAALPPAEAPALYALLATGLTFALAVALWRGVEQTSQRLLGPRIG